MYMHQICIHTGTMYMPVCTIVNIYRILYGYIRDKYIHSK